jgi:hypothetical protein
LAYGEKSASQCGDKINLIAEKSQPSHIFEQAALIAAEAGSKYFLCSSLYVGGEVWVIFGASWPFCIFRTRLSLF